LRSAVPVPLVLHGSSGVADDDLRRAVTAGLVKINVGTLLNVRFTEQVRDYLHTHDTVTDPRKYLAPARTAITDAVAELLAVIS
jgi:fructose-bisphosphate aldolase class II